MKISIADSLFLPHGKTAKLGGVNKSVQPAHFEWEAASPEAARFVTDSHLKDARGEGQVALLLETFFLHPEDYLTAMEKPFEHVLTHNSYFAKHKGWLRYPHGGSFVGFDNWKVHGKTKGVSILLSPKMQLWGHRMFHEVVESYGDKLDVFGLDGHIDKMEAIAPYRFTVVVEAERNESFFSEKLIDCLALGTVPIYWGCPNIGDFFDTVGMFLPRNMDEIGTAISMANQDSYEMRMKHIRINLELARGYAIPENWIFERYPFLFEEVE